MASANPFLWPLLGSTPNPAGFARETLSVVPMQRGRPVLVDSLYVRSLGIHVYRNDTRPFEGLARLVFVACPDIETGPFRAPEPQVHGARNGADSHLTTCYLSIKFGADVGFTHRNTDSEHQHWPVQAYGFHCGVPSVAGARGGEAADCQDFKE